MTESNRVQLAIVAETTPGVTPTNPRMRKMRMTGEGLTFTPNYVDSGEIRPDRMIPDPILTITEAGGTINYEESYPVDLSPLSELDRLMFYNDWVNTAFRDNNIASSSITSVTASGGVVGTATGTSFLAGTLVRLSGFTNAANNGVFNCTTGSATVPAFTGQGLVNEASPPAVARMKTVGVMGASGDITATSTGLGSTTLDFTTLGLAIGQWIKIGGSGTAFRFATAADNDWVRVTAIAATALTCDNLPAGWATDAGTSVTLKIWYGDEIKNGVLERSLTVERGYLGQTVPTYIVERGMHGKTRVVNIVSRQKIDCTATLYGMSGGQSQLPQQFPHFVTGATVVAGGTGGTPGAVTITGTTGTGTKFQATGTISGGGALTGPLVVTVAGSYTADPTDYTDEPVTGGSLSGATVFLTLAGTTDAATTNRVMAANANVGRLAASGSNLSSPNWAKSITFTQENNSRYVDDVESQSPVAVRAGEATVSGRVDTYFGDPTLLAQFYNNVATNLNTRVQKDNQALIYAFPRVTYRTGGNPNATAKNTDVMLTLDFTASIDTLTNAHIIKDRVEYYEA